MNHARAYASWIILGLALIVMVMPLPGKDDRHLLSEAEASDATLVILTTDSEEFLQPLVAAFVDDTDARVRIERVDPTLLSQKALASHKADLVLVRNIGEMVPLMQEEALDTLPLDIVWNVNEAFRDPAERWVGFTGRMEDNTLAMSGLALAQSSNSKPLAERFILYLYSRKVQEQLVNQTGQYSFLAYGVPTPAGLPDLTLIDAPAYGAIYDSAAFTEEPSRELASNQ
ncbi:MAG: hypothetical protein L0154_28745 [Chloroflexi bacterium]|nr:hypothetical protein [Chloroflexota bacterium]